MGRIGSFFVAATLVLSMPAAAGITFPEAGIVPLDARKASGDRIAVSVDRTRFERGDATLALPGSGDAPVVARFDRIDRRRDGRWTWIGQVDTVFGPQSAVITFGDGAAFGHIPQPSGTTLRIDTARGLSWLADAASDVMPDPANASREARATPSRGVAKPASAVPGRIDTKQFGEVPLVDVLVAYTPPLVAKMGTEAEVRTVIAYLEASTNQAFIDSRIPGQIRVVASQMVDYTINNDLNSSLDDIFLPSTLAIKQQIDTLRAQAGADLVVLLRDYDPATMGSICGVAEVNGWHGKPFAASDGFSVVAYGVSPGPTCPGVTFQHELGHNFGSDHDYQTAGGGYGAWTYSRGHRETVGSNGFGTIMSYPSSPQRYVNLFSNPDVHDCLFRPCGVADYADNRRTLSQSLPLIAAYLPTKVPLDLPTLSIDDATYGEQDPAVCREVDWCRAKVRLRLSAAVPRDVVLDIGTADGTATAGEDYIARREVGYVIPAGATEVEYEVPVLDDDIHDPGETFHVVVSNVRNAQLGDGEAVVTLVGDSTLDVLPSEHFAGRWTDDYDAYLADNGDGEDATEAPFVSPHDVAAGPDGTVYILDHSGRSIRKVGRDGIITTFVADRATGAGTSFYSLDTDRDGNIYALDVQGVAVWKFTPGGTGTKIAGNGTKGWSGDGGPAVLAGFEEPWCLAVAPDGRVVVGDMSRLREIGTDGIIRTIAGTGTAGTDGDGGPAVAAQVRLHFHCQLEFDDAGNLYVGGQDRIRRIDTSGTIRLFAGAPTYPLPPHEWGQPVPATQTPVLVQSMAVDRLGGVVVFHGDYGLRRISHDGFLDKARLGSAPGLFPWALALGPGGTMYLLEASQYRASVYRLPFPEVPSAPPSVGAVAGNARAALTIAASSDPGGGEILAYETESAPAGADDAAAGTAVLTRQVTGLANGTGYRFRARARNAHGAGPWSPWSNAVTPAAGKQPSIAVADADVVEGDSGTRNLRFVLSLSAPAPAGGVGYTIATANGSADSASDYTARSVTGSIPAGQSTATFDVAVKGDTRGEHDETLRVRLSGVTGAAVARGTATGTIRNDDTTIAIRDLAVAEGESKTSAAQVVVELAYPSATLVKFSARTTDGTAKAGSDYLARSVVDVTIPAGATRATLPVQIVGERVPEPDEDFRVAISNVTGAAVGDAEATVTIVNDDAVLSFSGVELLEGGHTRTLAVAITLSTPAPLGGVSFRLATRDGAATAGSDYTALSSTVVIPSGAASASATLTVHGDATFEGDEDFFLEADNITGSFSAPVSARFVLLDDDQPVDATIDTVAGNGWYPSEYEPIANRPALEARIGSVAALAGLPDGAYVFAQGDALWRVGDDGIVRRFAGNGSRGFSGDGGPATSARFGALAAPVAGADGRVLIVDGENGRIRRIGADGTIDTIAGNGDLRVHGDGGPALAAGLGYITGAAVAPDGVVYLVSYDAKTQEESIRAIGTDGIVRTVVGGGDETPQQLPGELDPTRLRIRDGGLVVFGAPTPGTLVYAHSYNDSHIYRLDPDGIARRIAGSHTGPGLTGAPAIARETRLGWVAAGTIAPDGHLHIVYGHAVQRLSRGGVWQRVAGSASAEGFAGDGGPALNALLDGPRGIAFDGRGRMLIADTGNLRIRRVSALESTPGPPRDVVATAGNGSAKVTFVPPANAGSSPVTGYEVFSSPGGGADPGGDSLSRTITGLKNGTAYTFRVRAITAFGPGPLSLPSAPVTPSATTPPALSIADVSVTEGDSGSKSATFTVTLSKAAPSAVTFSIATADGTARAGTDYVARSLTGQTIAAGASSATFAVTVNGDTTVEPDETFTVTVSAVQGATVADGVATGTIRDDDSTAPPPLATRNDRVVLAENATATTVEVLANDVFDAARLAGGSLAVTGVGRGVASIATRGTATPADDAIVYTPPANAGGDVTVGYRLCEGGAGARCVDGALQVVIRPLLDAVVATPADGGFVDVPAKRLRALPQASFVASRLVAPVVQRPTLAVDSTPWTPWDAGRVGTASVVRTIAAAADGQPRTWAVLVDAVGTADVDLYLGVDTDGDGTPDAGETRCTAAMSKTLERCELLLQHPGTGTLRWWAMAHNRGNATQTARLDVFEIADVAGDARLVATGPGNLPAAAAFDVRVAWNDPTLERGGARAGYVAVLSGATMVGAFPVRIDRAASAPSSARALGDAPLQLRLAAGEAQDRLFIDVPAGASAMTVTTTSTQNIDLYLAKAAAPSAAESSIPAAPARAQAVASAVGAGGNESLTVSGAALTPGRWYVTPVNAGGATALVTVKATITGVGPALRYGSFFNPDRSGHGIFVYPAGGYWAGLWYTYFEDGTPTWYYVQGLKPGANGVFEGELYRAAWQGTANHQLEVGRVRITPTGPDDFRFAYTLDGKAGSEPMTSLGRGCPVLGGAPLDISSHWFNPEKSGTGYSVQMWPTYEYYAAFVYDGWGVPRFLTGERNGFGGAEATIDLEQLRGFCPTCTRTGAPTRAPVGVFSRKFGGGTIQRLQLDAIYGDGVPGAWTGDEGVQALGGPASMQGCAQ